MTSFVQWYLRSLGKRPMMTNLASAGILMTAGDVLAQELERFQMGDRVAGANPHIQGVPLERRLNLRRYGTHGQPSRKDTGEEPPEGPPSILLYDNMHNTSNWHEAAQIIWEVVKQEIQALDYFRIATMVAWTVGFTTPSMILIYRFCDRVFPQTTPATIGARVLISVLWSIPTNALFFAYGTSMHHTMEWEALREEWREELVELGLEESVIDNIMDNGPVFDWEMMLAKAWLKVKSELVATVSTSMKIWIPINLFNFAVNPPHLQPLTNMFFSFFWNCYLSLMQHRDVALPADASDQ